MTAFINHFSFEFKTGLRNRNLLVTNYLLPLVFYVMMGFVMVEINPQFAAVLIPAMVVFTMMVSTMIGMPPPLTEAREAGVYRSYKINGVPAISILTIPVLTTVFHALIVSTIIALTGGSVFDGVLPENWLAFASITLLIGITFGAIGALIGVVSASTTSAVMLSQLIFIPSILLGGMMIPLEVLPESVRWLSALFPATYAMEAFNGLAYGRETIIDPAAAVTILGISMVLSFTLAVYLFNWDSHNSTRKGNPLLALLAAVPFVAGAVYIAL